jgi:hypothetical protein
MWKPFRQGDVLLVPAMDVDVRTCAAAGHLVLAEGEATGHRHQITQGQAELIERDGVVYLRVISETAQLTHEEHGPIAVPQGIWQVQIQREYSPGSWRYVAD